MRLQLTYLFILSRCSLNHWGCFWSLPLLWSNADMWTDIQASGELLVDRFDLQKLEQWPAVDR